MTTEQDTDILMELAGNLATLQDHHQMVAQIVSPLEWRLPLENRSELREALDKSSTLMLRLRETLEQRVSA